jgi:hypothetical protein
MRASAAALLVCLLAAGPAAAREHHVDGKHHLQRAAELAGAGKCAAAVKEYTAAYEALHDPIVLFNRGECYRRLGENAKAAEDYRGYLKGFPGAPNRAELEGRIAALERPAPATPRPATAPRPPATSPPRPAVVQPLSPPAPAQHPVAGASAAAPAPRSPATTPAAPLPFLPPPPLAGGGDPNALVEAPRAPLTTKDSAHDEAHGTHWLLWTSLAVVAVGGGVAGYVFLRPKDPGPPPSMYGNYRF